MARQQIVSDASGTPLDDLEEIARRLTSIHASVATNLDGGRQLQTWTRKEIEGILALLDRVIEERGAR